MSTYKPKLNDNLTGPWWKHGDYIEPQYLNNIERGILQAGADLIQMDGIIDQMNLVLNSQAHNFIIDDKTLKLDGAQLIPLIYDQSDPATQAAIQSVIYEMQHYMNSISVDGTTIVVGDGEAIDEVVSNNSAIGSKIFISPERFGAKGDGETDDTATLQEALNYGVMTNSEVVLRGTYLISNSLILQSHMHIYGYGCGTIKKTENTNKYAALLYWNDNNTPIEDVIIDGLTIIGNRQWTNQTLSNPANDVGIRIEGGTESDDGHDIKIVKCIIKNCGGCGILVKGTRILIQGNTVFMDDPEELFIATGIPNYNFGISHGGNNVKIINNTIKNTIHGIIAGIVNKNTLIEGNDISTYANGQHGMYIQGGDNLNISNNIVHDCAIVGIKVQLGHADNIIKNINIVANNIKNCNNQGILIARESSVNDEDAVIQDINITNNNIENVVRGVEILSSSKCVISNNLINVNSGSNIGYGIKFNNISHISLLGNKISTFNCNSVVFDYASGTLGDTDSCIIKNNTLLMNGDKEASELCAIYIKQMFNSIIKNNIISYIGSANPFIKAIAFANNFNWISNVDISENKIDGFDSEIVNIEAAGFLEATSQAVAFNLLTSLNANELPVFKMPLNYEIDANTNKIINDSIVDLNINNTQNIGVVADYAGIGEYDFLTQIYTLTHGCIVITEYNFDDLIIAAGKTITVEYPYIRIQDIGFKSIGCNIYPSSGSVPASITATPNIRLLSSSTAVFIYDTHFTGATGAEIKASAKAYFKENNLFPIKIYGPLIDNPETDAPVTITHPWKKRIKSSGQIVLNSHAESVTIKDLFTPGLNYITAKDNSTINIKIGQAQIIGKQLQNDVSTAINNAFSDASITKVTVPIGQYIIANTINIPANKTLELAGDYHQDNEPFATLIPATANMTMITMENNSHLIGGCLNMGKIPEVKGIVLDVHNTTIEHSTVVNTKIVGGRVDAWLPNAIIYNQTGIYIEGGDSTQSSDDIGGIQYCSFDCKIMYCGCAYQIHRAHNYHYGHDNTSKGVWFTNVTVAGLVYRCARGIWSNCNTSDFSNNAWQITADFQAGALYASDNEPAYPGMNIQGIKNIITGNFWDYTPGHSTPGILFEADSHSNLFLGYGTAQDEKKNLNDDTELSVSQRNNIITNLTKDSLIFLNSFQPITAYRVTSVLNVLNSFSYRIGNLCFINLQIKFKDANASIDANTSIGTLYMNQSLVNNTLGPIINMTTGEIIGTAKVASESLNPSIRIVNSLTTPSDNAYCSIQMTCVSNVAFKF